MRVAALALAALVLVLPPEGGSYRNEWEGGSSKGEGFIEAAAATGLTFTHVNGASGQYYMPEQMGAGVALFDYDNDGDLDVFFVQGAPDLASAMPDAPRAAKRLQSRLFRNDLTVGADGKRSLHFTDVTGTGMWINGYGMGVAVADVNNDGYLDLFVTGFGAATLLNNDGGDGSFTDFTNSAGVSEGGVWSTSASFVDYDRDGFLDLFVAHYLDFSIAGNKVCRDALGARDYCSPRAYQPVPSRLYRNGGRGQYTDVTERAGVRRAYGAGLGVATGDYNEDGWPDLYVANDATPNQLWINQRNGTFADEGLLSGAAFNASGNPEGSMGIASGDVTLDGHEDLFVTNIAGETFAMYVNDGHAVFEDARVKTGLAALTAPYTGFGTGWLDYDNDGLLDLFIANGAVNVLESQRGQPLPFKMPNQLLHNTGGRFEDAGASGGEIFRRLGIGRGAAFGDLDNDGDIDIVATNNAGPALLLLNQTIENGSPNHWLTVEARQPDRNRFAYGAWVGVERAGKPTLWRRVGSDGSYLSASDSRVHFGLGASPSVDAIVVQWPDGQRQRRTAVPADRVLTVTRSR